MIQTERKGKYLELTIPRSWQEYTLDTLLRNYWKAPKKLIHEWRMSKDIWIHNEAARWNDLLKAGDKILLPLFEHPNHDIEPAYMELNVLFEDDHLLIVNKPPFTDTHPSSAGQTDTLLNGVAYYLMTEGTDGAFTHVHRLDKDTTGAILFAKHALSSALLSKMMEEKEIKRTYRAIVHGKLRNKQGTIDQPIGKDRHHATRRRISPTGQKAITHFQQLQYDPGKDLSLLECRLDTGRTHQIRVHLSSIGHPLAGDILYGGRPIFNRQALHSYEMAFIHPITKENIKVTAPYCDNPSIFQQVKN